MTRTRRRGWVATANIKPLLDDVDGDAHAQVVAASIANTLEWALYPEYESDMELEEIIDNFRFAETQDQVNDTLSDLYDWADEHRVWLGIRGS